MPNPQSEPPAPEVDLDANVTVLEIDADLWRRLEAKAASLQMETGKMISDWLWNLCHRPTIAPISRQQRWKLARSLRGLCVQCGKPALPFHQCPACREKHRNRVAAQKGARTALRV